MPSMVDTEHAVPDWRHRAACAEPARGDRFFVASKATAESTEAAAKAMCATCPVIEVCREWALSTREEFGVLGGMTEGERRTELRRRARRPRNAGSADSALGGMSPMTLTRRNASAATAPTMAACGHGVCFGPGGCIVPGHVVPVQTVAADVASVGAGAAA